MEKKKWLRFETKIMDMLAEEYREQGQDFDEVSMEFFMDRVHQSVENAATDFAEMLDLEYTPVFFYGG